MIHWCISEVFFHICFSQYLPVVFLIDIHGVSVQLLRLNECVPIHFVFFVMGKIDYCLFERKLFSCTKLKSRVVVFEVEG